MTKNNNKKDIIDMSHVLIKSLDLDIGGVPSSQCVLNVFSITYKNISVIFCCKIGFYFLSGK